MNNEGGLEHDEDSLLLSHNLTVLIKGKVQMRGKGEGTKVTYPSAAPAVAIKLSL